MNRHLPQTWVSASRGTYIMLAGACLAWLNIARVLAQTDSQPPPFGGPWDSRLKLTGDWGGVREDLRDHGFTFDISSTTFYQGIASGGLERGSEFGGRNDYWLNVDGQKAGLWPGFFVTLRGEPVSGASVNRE